MGDVKRIGVMMDLDKPFKRHMSIFAGIQDYARKHADWKIVVDDFADQALPSNPEKPSPYDGVVGRITKLGGDRARRHDLPAVNVWYSSPAKGLPGVFPDFAASGRLVAEHLLSRGFKYLGSLRQRADKGTTIQARAMHECLHEAGFQGWIGEETIEDVTSHAVWRRCVRRVECWMDSWNVPLGLLIGDQTWARVIVALANDRGWHCPEQIAIVCTHNDEILCDHPEPGLSAVDLPEELRGYEAAKILDGLIDAKRRGISPYAHAHERLLEPLGITSRHSTDFFAVDNPLVGQALRYIAAHLHKPLEVATVARELGIARRTLDGWFRDSIGVTVATEIARLRIERVKRELLAGSDLIEAIARRTGFANTQTLNNQFRKITGLSPSEFREQGRTRRAEVSAPIRG